jgi:hypothetical protein
VVTLAVLVCVGIGVGAWQARALKSAAGVAGVGLADPRPTFAAEAAPPLARPPAEPTTRSAMRTQRTLAHAANNAARELAGSEDGSVVGWLASTGLWSRPYHPKGMPPNWKAPQWWQSALSFTTLVRYLQQTHSTQAAYQQLIAHTYSLNISLPGTHEPYNFANQFMDDTAWWGMGWLDAARYEVTVRRDTSDADRYLSLAEADVRYIYSRPRPCHTQGIEWQVDYPPDAIANEEFVAYAAQLSALRSASGALHPT